MSKPTPNPHLFTDRDGDRWVRGADSTEVILLSPRADAGPNLVRRSQLKFYFREPTSMHDCAHAAFKALWPSESE